MKSALFPSLSTADIHTIRTCLYYAASAGELYYIIREGFDYSFKYFTMWGLHLTWVYLLFSLWANTDVYTGF